MEHRELLLRFLHELIDGLSLFRLERCELLGIVVYPCHEALLVGETHLAPVGFGHDALFGVDFDVVGFVSELVVADVHEVGAFHLVVPFHRIGDIHKARRVHAAGLPHRRLEAHTAQFVDQVVLLGHLPAQLNGVTAAVAECDGVVLFQSSRRRPLPPLLFGWRVGEVLPPDVLWAQNLRPRRPRGSPILIFRRIVFHGFAPFGGFTAL